MKFSKALLQEKDLPWSALEDRVIETTRWSVIHEIVFEHEGKFYETSYSIGATEMQHERPWEFEKEVECTEVRKVQKLVEVWEPVPSETAA